MHSYVHWCRAARRPTSPVGHEMCNASNLNLSPRTGPQTPASNSSSADQRSSLSALAYHIPTRSFFLRTVAHPTRKTTGSTVTASGTCVLTRASSESRTPGSGFFRRTLTLSPLLVCARSPFHPSTDTGTTIGPERQTRWNYSDRLPRAHL